ncbi:hypothetical protein [Nitrosomonas sp.]|uniref:hypothetical protein n=1 Tax=Nitrosomonas sp. TaxID=42353 RepID=UPI00374C91D0
MSGRGTSGGVVFQSEVGADLAALILTERPMSRLGKRLPGTPKKLFFEAATAVDDIVVETEYGKIYIQAKRTISLSKSGDSELASVAQQFVRQFRAGAIDDGIRRDLNLAHDRLILAIGDETPQSVAIHLHQALEKSRTGAATALPETLSSALKTFSDLIDAAWFDEVSTPISSATREQLLSFCTVVKIGESQRQSTTEILQNVVANPGEEAALHDLLVKWAADASQDGTGGNANSLRNSLRDTIRLKEAPSFSEDVKGLSIYSAHVTRRLKRFTELNTPNGDITISRPIVDVVVEAAKKGSLIITGEPGAGKSAVIFKSAEILKKEAVVVVLTVEAGSISLETLRQEIQLIHPLTDVLRQMASGKSGYLFVDALDAVRGGLAEQTYKKLIQEVIALPDWKVIASVRTFDLRLGKEWRSLFAGKAPSPEHSDKNFSNVRHIHVGLLDEQEKDDIALKSPSLSQAIKAAGPRVEALTQNPFNLGLVADLLKTGLTPESLTQVRTRGQLLEAYWQQRITELGTPATVALRIIVSLMIESRSIDLPETEIPMEAAATVDLLQQVGVLIVETNRRVGFRHHVLFDYAIARLLLLPDRVSTLKLFSKDKSIGLLISPSLAYWLEELKKNLKVTDYWTYAVLVIGSKSIDPIIRVEFARLAVEAVVQDEPLTPLAQVLKTADTDQRRALSQIVGSLFTKANSKQAILTKPWAGFVSELDKPSNDELGSIHVLIGLLLDNHNSPEDMACIGVASRRLFEIMSNEDRLIPWLAPYVIKYVAQTYATDPVASRILLERLFTEDRFAKWGHIEVPNLAQEVKWFAETDPDFVAKVYYRVFLGGNFRQDQVTPMSNSWILSVSSNAAQDFNIAEHYLSEAFTSLIKMSPETGIRAFAATIRGQFEGQHLARGGEQIQNVLYGNTEKAFKEDGSHIWAWDVRENQYDEYAKIYQSFVNWALALEDVAVIQNIPDLVFQETNIALAWKALFEIAAEKPKALGVMLWQAAAGAVALNSLETRQTAIAMLSAVYPYQSKTECQQVEKGWLQRDFSIFQDPKKARLEIIGTLFECIGEMHLATEEARDFLINSKNEGEIFDNRMPLNFETHWESSGGHWLEYEGIDVKDTQVAQLIDLNNAVNNAKDILSSDESEEHGIAMWDAVIALHIGTVTV